jgi:hypothetical protein
VRSTESGRDARVEYPMGYVERVSEVVRALRLWTPRRWRIATLSAIGIALLVAIPTAVIPSPLFGRAVEVTWWSYPTVVLSGLLGGMLLATYIREPGSDHVDNALKLGTVGGFLSFFAVGCPVCNKVVLLALGTSGAMTWFAPVQPLLALASVLVLGASLVLRLRGQVSCTMQVVQ